MFCPGISGKDLEMENTVKMLEVYDTSANHECPVRQHDVKINGEILSITFEAGKRTLMPRDVGLKFMKPGFRVYEKDSTVELTRPPVTDETVKNRIAVDEVVAKYEELTGDALKMRAAVFPGGEAYIAGNVARADLIDFLKRGPQKPAVLKPVVPEPQEEVLSTEPEEAGEIDLEVVEIDDVEDAVPMAGFTATQLPAQEDVITDVEAVEIKAEEEVFANPPPEENTNPE